jgi:GntR family transcriptional regulator
MAPRKRKEQDLKALELFDSIDINGNHAVYVQIENQVRFGIAAGVLKPNDQLPPSTALADKLKVNFNTVTKAYRDLEVMGLLYTRRGMGVYIQEGAQPKCRQAVFEELAARIHEVVAEAKASGMASTQVQNVVKKCLASETKLYGPVPPSIAALAKTR